VVDKLRLVTLAAINTPPPISPTVGIQQLLKQIATQAMKRRANGHLAGFKIQVTSMPNILKNPDNNCVYFLRRFGKNRLRNVFFSASSSASSVTRSAGRNRQIFSLTDTNSLHNWRNR
jgi:hypothetical protein